jgi:hypothetical protein
VVYVLWFVCCFVGFFCVCRKLSSFLFSFSYSKSLMFCIFRFIECCMKHHAFDQYFAHSRCVSYSCLFRTAFFFCIGALVPSSSYIILLLVWFDDFFYLPHLPGCLRIHVYVIVHVLVFLLVTVNMHGMNNIKVAYLSVLYDNLYNTPRFKLRFIYYLHATCMYNT